MSAKDYEICPASLNAYLSKVSERGQSLNKGHIHRHDVMCYAATKEEACKWLLNKIKEEEEEK